MLSNVFSSGHRSYLWNRASTQGRTIIHRITIIMTTGKCVFIMVSHPSVSINMLIFIPHSTCPGVSTLELKLKCSWTSTWNTRAVVSISPLRFTLELKSLSPYLRHNGLPLASSSTTIAKLIIHQAVYNETHPYGVSQKKRQRRQRSNQMQ